MYINLEYKDLISASGILVYLCTCCNLTSLNMTVFTWPSLLTDPRGSSVLHLRDHGACANGWVLYRLQGHSQSRLPGTSQISPIALAHRSWCVAAGVPSVHVLEWHNTLAIFPFYLACTGSMCTRASFGPAWYIFIRSAVTAITGSS